MKRLTFHDMNKEDSLQLSFDGAFDHRAELERELEPFLQALEQYAGDWMPDRVQGKRYRKYSREAVFKSLREERTESGSIIGFYRTTSPALSFVVNLGLTDRRHEIGVSLKVQPVSFFTSEERCRSFVDLVRAWVSRYPVPDATAHSMADEQLAGAPFYGRDEKTKRRDGYDNVYQLCWLHVFGPHLVEKLGRERVLSTPAHRIEALPNGSVLLVSWPTAADFASEPARVAQARALVHLRPELDFESMLATLRERSAALVPIEPRFHPDIAPLLARVLDHSPISERQRKIAELNAYQPPLPDEWLPAGAALPVDVADPEQARASYSTAAEHLVALLHSEVPSVFEETPESLTEVDYSFWRQEFPRVFERAAIDALAVPAAGAYLGEVLVRRLGGRWLPRKNVQEAQVLVGQRVWLPFLRAQRYLRTQQSLLDYSLTQLYREAERHRFPAGQH
jgi:hypothetical protein